MRVRMQLPKQERARGGGVPLAMYKLKTKEVREEYQSAVEGELASRPYVPSDTSEQKWSDLQESVMLAAER